MTPGSEQGTWRASNTAPEGNEPREAGTAMVVSGAIGTPTPAPVTGSHLSSTRVTEIAFYIILGVAAVLLRLWDLGDRAYHHDESLHAYYSWMLYTGSGFMHNPLMHGPLLFDVTALGFFLFGDNLAAPRIFPALFGTVLVFMPLFLRNRLGSWGAGATAALLAMSPSLFYFSRFIRADIFALVFEMGTVICIWRYLDRRQNRYLYLMAGCLALLFSTKETSYILMAVLTSFLLIWWSQRWLPTLWRGSDASKGRRFWASFAPARLEARGQILLLMITLTLPLASALVGFVVQQATGGLVLVNNADNWQSGAVGAPSDSRVAYLVATAITGTMFLCSAALGTAWRAGTWAIAFGIFYAVFFFLHTTGFTNMIGVGSGVWQGLGYWIAQQSVERGSQPWYYYLILLPLYESLAFSIGILAIAAALRRLGLRVLGIATIIGAVGCLLAASILLVAETKILYAPLGLSLVAVTWLALRRGGDPFEWFLVYWIVMGFLLYVVAGEKMPWLVTHLLLPLAVLAGRFLGRALAVVNWGKTLRQGGLVVLLLSPCLLLLVRALTLSAQWERSPLGVWSFVGPLLFALVLLLLAVWLWVRMGSKPFAQMVLLSLVAMLGFVSVRSGYQAAFANGDVPVEMLVYTQTSPEIPALVSNIERLSRQTGAGRDFPIVIDTADGFGWPWYWYLRSYRKVSYLDLTGPATPPEADVLVVNYRNILAIAATGDRYYQGITIPFRQWFPESYRGYTVGAFVDDLLSAESWRRMLNYYTYRELSEDLGHVDSVVYYSRDLARRLPAAGGLIP